MILLIVARFSWFTILAYKSTSYPVCTSYFYANHAQKAIVTKDLYFDDDKLLKFFESDLNL